MSNLQFWESVEKSDPKQLKDIKGTKLKSIDAYSQIKRATEEWGMYGEEWGFEKVEIDYSLKAEGLVTFKGKFFYPDGKFPILSSIQFKEGKKVDEDFAKKVQTDALTKALSMLGFNADVFLGAHDGNKYNKRTGDSKEAAKKKQLTPEMYKQLKESRNLPKVIEVLTGGEYKFTPTQRKGLQSLKNELITEK